MHAMNLVQHFCERYKVTEEYKSLVAEKQKIVKKRWEQDIWMRSKAV